MQPTSERRACVYRGFLMARTRKTQTFCNADRDFPGFVQNAKPRAVCGSPGRGTDFSPSARMSDGLKSVLRAGLPTSYRDWPTALCAGLLTPTRVRPKVSISGHAPIVNGNHKAVLNNASPGRIMSHPRGLIRWQVAQDDASTHIHVATYDDVSQDLCSNNAPPKKE